MPVLNPSPTDRALIIGAAASLFALPLLFRLVRPPTANHPAPPLKAIASPRKTQLPSLSSAEAAELPYPPNALPGARDVETPYGSIRLYEWGPEDGKKVVITHGDATPAPVFGPIARGLVEHGCRIMVLDLWGRGYSDSPLNVKYDSRLFSTQILLAIASSPLSWTGSLSGGFSILGFSLGGGIAMAFAANFPHLVNSIILLGPGGIVPQLPKSYNQLFLQYPSVVPSRYIRRLIGKLLGVDFRNRPDRQATAGKATQKQTEVSSEDTSELAQLQEVDVSAIVQWQFENHQGFIHAFLNTLWYGPVMHEHLVWTRVGKLIKGEISDLPVSDSPSRLQGSDILIICGSEDTVIEYESLRNTMMSLFGGSQHLRFETVPGDHGFSVSRSNEVVDLVSHFLDLP